MPRTLISPVGLSILQGPQGLRNLQVELTVGQERRQLKEFMRARQIDAKRLSAELATLAALKAQPEDEAIFLATDTDESEQAARLNTIVAEDALEVPAQWTRVPSLVLNDETVFRTKGIPNLVQALDRKLAAAQEQGRTAYLSVGGGIKPVVPYIAVYGMLRRIPIAYTFERTGKLIILPPLPIDFDWDALALAERAIRAIEENTAIPCTELKRLLGDALPSMEGLFEQEDDLVTLSAFGDLVTRMRQAQQEKPVLLYPSARQKFESLQGIEHDIIDAMLAKVRDPQVRAIKTERWWVGDPDLSVYRQRGDTAGRLVYWVAGECAYIAEIYTEHARYKREMPNLRKQDYDMRRFTPHWPSVEEFTEEPATTDDEVSSLQAKLSETEENLRKAQERVASGERDGEVAFAMASGMEEKLRKAEAEATGAKRDCDAARTRTKEREQQLAVAEDAVKERDRLIAGLREWGAALEAQQKQMVSWRLLRRLRWALFGL